MQNVPFPKDLKYMNFFGIKSLFSFCSLPMRLDSYKGCAHGCLYCFSQKLNNRQDGFFSKVLPANPMYFKKYLDYALHRSSGKGPISSSIKHHLPFHWGCASDPFQPIEKTFKVTEEILKVFNEIQYPFVISTKSIMASERPYIDYLSNTPCSVQYSFSTFDENLAQVIEPLASPPYQRLKALEALANRGIYTVARLQPFLYSYENIPNDLFKKLSNAGVKHVVIEHLRIPTNLRRETKNKLSIIYKEAYGEEDTRCSRINKEINSSIKLKNIVFYRKEIHRMGMRFGSGDNEFHHLSDNLCCCGVPKVDAFKNIYLGHYGMGVMKGLKEKAISFDYIETAWHPDGSIREYLNSDCRGMGSCSIKYLLKEKIKNPTMSNSPMCFYAVEKCGLDRYKIKKKLLDSFLGGDGNE